MSNVHIYQIYYSEDTKAALDPGFIPLDNMANERPDWREYWPIRNFFKSNPLQDGHYYGFLSPKFRQKSRLTSEQVRAFMEKQPDADVFLFSPMADLASFTLNVFEQGEANHPGLGRTSQSFFDRSGLAVELKKLITDSTNTVFCNYFVARADFWKRWFGVTEKLFAICESGDGRLARELTADTSYGDAPAPMKVFVVERIASLLLCLHPELKASTYCPYDLPPSNNPVFSSHPSEAAICDALKIAYRAQRYPQYMRLFNQIRSGILAERDAALAEGGKTP